LAGNNSDVLRIETATRAAWLYFVAGNTQEEIARKLRISRPAAQRLITFAVSERLITFRVERRLAACMELSERLRERFALQYCEIVPTDPQNPQSLIGVAVSAANFVEQMLASSTPSILAIGSGRTLRAAVERMTPIEARQHTLVALVGNIVPDGSASFYDVLPRLADITKATHYPIPLPVLMETNEQREMFAALPLVRRVHALAAKADAALVGVGQMDLNCPQFEDGFISRAEVVELMKAGAVGEVTGWNFDKRGKILTNQVNSRLTSAPPERDSGRLVVGVAIGEAKVQAIFSAVIGKILTGVITDEATAKRLLALQN
jgi:DNA-binding transcriptional regulator LsrR (DeoR family)